MHNHGKKQTGAYKKWKYWLLPSRSCLIKKERLVADNSRIEYLHFFGIKSPFIETDRMKIASDELEYAIRNHPNSPEGFELMEEIDCFPPEKELLRLDEKTVRMYMPA